VDDEQREGRSEDAEGVQCESVETIKLEDAREEGEEGRPRGREGGREGARHAAGAAPSARPSSRWRLRARFDSYSCHSPLTSASLFRARYGRVSPCERFEPVLSEGGRERDAHGGHLGLGLLGREVRHAQRLVGGRALGRVEREQGVGEVEAGRGEVPASSVPIQHQSPFVEREGERSGVRATHLEKAGRSCDSTTSLGLTSSYHGRSCRPGHVSTLGVPVSLKMTSSWWISSWPGKTGRRRKSSRKMQLRARSDERVRDDSQAGGAEQAERDAPCTPHVDALVVHGRTEQELGRLVPLRDDAVRVVGLAPALVEPREAKVGDLEDARAAQEDVGPLEVAVEDAAAVNEAEPLEELLHERLEVRRRERDRWVVQHARQVVVEVVEDHVHVACCRGRKQRQRRDLERERVRAPTTRRRKTTTHLWTRASRTATRRSGAAGSGGA